MSTSGAFSAHPTGYERFSANEGENLLQNLIDNQLIPFEKGGLAEQRLANITLQNARVGGKLDRIDIQDGEVLISDYKTGKSLSSFDTKDQTKTVKAWRHRTQLLFYCLLASQDSRFNKAKKIGAQMIYVEADKTNQLLLGLAPTTDELERPQRLIEVVWQHIMKLQFPDVSDYPATYSRES